MLHVWLNGWTNKPNQTIFRQPPVDASNIFLWNTAPQTTCYSNLDHTMFLHHCENLSYELWNIIDKSVDGSCWENWMTSTTLFSLQTQYLMQQCFASLLCYSLFYFRKWNKKGKIYNKIKTPGPFWNAEYWEFYICRWIYSENNCQSYMKLSTLEWNNYKYIYH